MIGAIVFVTITLRCKDKQQPTPDDHPVQDDEAIRKIMEQEHKDQEALYLERHKNACN